MSVFVLDGPCSLMGAQPIVLLLIRRIEGRFNMGKKVLNRHKHCSQAGKCHSSESIQVGVRPLNINSKN